jgi:hypothetical protein
VATLSLTDKKTPEHMKLHPSGKFLAALTFGITATSSHAALLFTDNFNIPDTGSLDGSDQTGRHAGIIASDVVLRSGGVQHTISGGQLNVLPTSGSPNVGRVRLQSAAALPTSTMYDFGSGLGGAQMLADGGFRFEFDWTPPDNSSNNWISFSLGANVFDQFVAVNSATTDFGIIFRNNGVIDTFDNGSGTSNGSTFDITNVTQRHATLDFAFSSFADGSSVTASIMVDNVSVGAPLVFDWNGNASVINMEMASITTAKPVDNISISTIPEPSGAMLLGLAGLIATGRRRRK